jgi:hypothetical protein
VHVAILSSTDTKELVTKKTKVIQHDLNPQFNEKMTFKVQSFSYKVVEKN